MNTILGGDASGGNVVAAAHGDPTPNSKSDFDYFVNESINLFGVNPFSIIPKLKQFLPKYKTITNVQQKMSMMFEFIMSISDNV